jgi:hypothetical protein
MGLADFPSMLNRFFIWIKNKSIIKNGHQRCSIDVSVGLKLKVLSRIDIKNITQTEVMSPDVLSLGMFCPDGCFVLRTLWLRHFVLTVILSAERFVPLDVLSYRTFCLPDVLSQDVLSPDVLSLDVLSGKLYSVNNSTIKSNQNQTFNFIAKYK